MIRKTFMPFLILMIAALAGCQEYGKVEQGRVVAFDNGTVTMLLDVSPDAFKPDYSGQALTFTLPTDPAETGALPKAGLCINVDPEKKSIAMYDPASGSITQVAFEVADQHKNIDRSHVLVFDAATNKARPFPQINAAEHSVTTYLRKRQTVVTMKFAEADFARYKEADWVSGDEVRIYYREKGKALRFMNISKTDIFKK